MWRSVTDGPHTDIGGRFVVPDGEEAEVLNAADLNKIENDERAMRELRSGLGPDVSHHIADAKSAKEIWDNLATRFTGDKILQTTKVQEILADSGNFKQEENQTLEQCYERLSNMIYTLDKYGETPSQQEINIKFLYSLRKEWRPIMLMVKSYENIEKYKLAALYNLIKSHEPDILGRRSENAGSLALVSKDEEEDSDDDLVGYMVDKNREIIALYAANNRRFKKPFIKNNSRKPFNEKKSQVKDEAYYARKMEEIREKTKDLALMAADDYSGTYQVWSSDSDDNEVRKPTHSAFMAYDDSKCFPKVTFEETEIEKEIGYEGYAGLGYESSKLKEMMVTEIPKGWNDDSSDDDEEVCLMAKDTRLTIPEQVSKLLLSFNIPVSKSSAIIDEITRDCSVMHKLLVDAKNREKISDEDILNLRGRVKSLKLSLEKSSIRISLLRDNREKHLNNHDVILRQRNIFCENARRLYAHITHIYHSADLCNVQHRQLLPFLEFKLKNVDSISYECESIVSRSEATNPSYKHGLISVENHLTAENMLKLLPNEIPILQKNIPIVENKSEVIVKTDSESESESYVDERYDAKWYMDSGCSRHMTGKREYLRDYRTLDDAGNVPFGNNETCPIRGYDKITNGQFTINRVAFVEGLKHNLVSISQLVVGTENAKGINVSLESKASDRWGIIMSSIQSQFRSQLAMAPKTCSPKLQRLKQVSGYDLVRGMPALKFHNDSLCSACEHGKQTKQRHPIVINPKITEPLSLLYMDLCGPSAVESIGKKKYILVIVDDYLRFTWVLFLRNKSDAAEEIINFIKKMEIMLNKKVRTVHSDNGSEFKNQTLDGFLKTKGISHNFSAPYTPQKNGVVERRNRSLCEAARTMLNFANLPMAPDNNVSELSKLTDGPDDSSTSSVQRPSSVDREPSNRSEGNSGFEGEKNNTSLNNPSHEISHIMSLYPSVQGEPDISTPNTSTPVTSDNGITTTTPTAVEGEHTLNSSSHLHTPQKNVTNSNNHLITDNFPSTSGYPSDIEEIDSK
ncbi:hypothetical protein L1887_14895 [Cichorium endivia]|nr:hypothetical protein L1887_14895 [Cichorium endivia]